MFQGTGQTPFNKIMAQQLMNQGLQGGPVTSPWQTANKMLQSYLGAKMMGKYQTGMADERQGIVQALMGQPAAGFSPDMPPEQQIGPTQQGVAPDRQKALAMMLGSADPMLQKTGMASILQKPGETWGDPYAGPRGALVQRSSTGQVKQVVGPKKAGMIFNLTKGQEAVDKAYA